MINEKLLSESLILNEFFKSKEEKNKLSLVKKLKDKSLVNEVVAHSIKIAKRKGVNIVDNHPQMNTIVKDEVIKQQKVEEEFMGGVYDTDYMIFSVNGTKVAYIATVDKGKSIKTSSDIIGYFYVIVSPDKLKKLKLIVP